MAHPWIFESNFEAGTNAEWDSESDTGSKLDFPHYTTLAAIPGLAMPYRGAFCMRVDLRTSDTNDHTVTEGDIDIADGATRHFAFALFVSNDFTATADDTFNIFELQQSGGTIECSLGMRMTAATNALDIGIGDGTAPTSFVGFPRGRWVTVEWSVLISSGGSGTSTMYLDGAQAVALTSQTHAAAVGAGVLGTQNTLSTTTGTILFDRFIMDDARIYPPNQRWPDVVRLTKTGHVFVGPGCIASATLLSANGTLDIYDTDTANTNDASAKRIQLDTGEPNFVSNDSVTYFERGCYVVLAGTNAVGEIKLSRKGGSECGPTAYGSEGAIRSYAAKRTPRPQNV